LLSTLKYILSFLNSIFKSHVFCQFLPLLLKLIPFVFNMLKVFKNNPLHLAFCLCCSCYNVSVSGGQAERSEANSIRCTQG
ncbi:MAG: hypothetical protein Q9P14_15520, partial [candidate division KSB1 bacterium]|nr:hypothetical protein [candidate division KSB1 bacterium]